MGTNNKTIFNNDIARVYWNPDDYKGAGIDEIGRQDIPPFITLAHELNHAKDYVRYGASNQAIWFISPESIVRKSEYYTCFNENIIRAEHCLPLRRYYSSYSNEKPYSPSIIPIYTILPASVWAKPIWK